MVVLVDDLGTKHPKRFSIHSWTTSTLLDLQLPGFPTVQLAIAICDQYTKIIMEQYDKPSNGRKTYYYWNSEIRNWDSKTSEYWSYNGKEILLVPKTWLRFSFLCNAKQYLMMTIIEKIRDDDEWGDTPKKVIYENLERETEHWVYNYVVKSSKDNPELLTQYHNDAKRHYLRKYGTMDDDELDKRVY